MQLTIRAIDGDDRVGIETYVRMRNEITPSDGDSVANAAWEDATYPGQVHRLLAESEGEAVAAATVGRLHIYPPEHPGYYVGCWVLPGWRRRHIATALVDAAAEIARAAGKTEFRTWVSEEQEAGIAFLQRRGFEVIGRDKSVGLMLDGRPAPDHSPPPGFSIVRLADRPELVPDLWRVAVEAFPAIPSLTPVDPGPLEEFVARDVERTLMPKELFAVALDSATGEVAGYASLKIDPADAGIAYHDMTAVRPAYRNRGIATALKRATIAWAIEAGLRELHTGNDEENAPMRAVNAALGYLPRPDYLALRGPLLAPGPATGILRP